MNTPKIDGHRHILFSEAIEVASKLDPVRSVNIYPADIQAESEEINRKKGVEWNRKMHDFDENIADLEAAGMDMGVLQPTQTMFFYWAESPAAAELTRMVNEYTAQEVRKHAAHFLGLATIPLQDVDLAVKELTYAVKELGLKGVVTGSNVNGHGFDEQQFLPFFEAVEALDVPIFIHPNDPAGVERVKGYYLANFLSYPLESAIFATQLVFGGVLDRYRIASFHKRGDKVSRYGEDSPVVGYSYFHEKLLNWIIDRMNHQQDVGPTENIAEHLANANYPEQALISIGATRYTEYGETHFLQSGDTSIVVVYDGDKYSQEDVARMATNNVFAEDNLSALVQQVA